MHFWVGLFRRKFMKSFERNSRFEHKMAPTRWLASHASCELCIFFRQSFRLIDTVVFYKDRFYPKVTRCPKKTRESVHFDDIGNKKLKKICISWHPYCGQFWVLSLCLLTNFTRYLIRKDWEEKSLLVKRFVVLRSCAAFFWLDPAPVRVAIWTGKWNL